VHHAAFSGVSAFAVLGPGAWAGSAEKVSSNCHDAGATSDRVLAASPRALLSIPTQAPRPGTHALSQAPRPSGQIQAYPHDRSGIMQRIKSGYSPVSPFISSHSVGLALHASTLATAPRIGTSRSR